MEQEEFVRLLRRYRAGVASESEKRIVEKWYDEMQRNPNQSALDEEMENRYWAQVASRIKGGRTPHFDNGSHSKRNIGWFTVASIAASVAVAVFFVFHWHYSDKRTVQEQHVAFYPEADKTWQQVWNTTAGRNEVMLPDSSRVILQPQSSLRFPSRFDGRQREVYLEGEAFFDVVHREDQPFLVYANKLVTRVLGTSFTIKAFGNDKDIVVAVATGRVSVTSPSDGRSNTTKEIILTPNQKVVYDKDRETLSRSIVEKPLPVLEEEEVRKMRFEGAAVSEIFAAVEKLYGVDIVFDKERYAGCTLTTSVSEGGDLFNRLDIITSAIGASYTLRENTIIITGSGCD